MSPPPRDADQSMLDLAELAVTRVCHDLSGPLGTVMNAVELAAGGIEGALNGGGDLKGEALQLAGQAARELTDRLRFARVLWGQCGPMRTTEVLALANGLPASSRLHLRSAELRERVLPGAAARLLAGVMLLAAESLHGSGEIVLAGDPAREVVVMIAGPRAAWPADLARLLGPSPTPWVAPQPNELPTYLAVQLAAAAGARLSLLLATGAATGPPPLLIGLAA